MLVPEDCALQRCSTLSDFPTHEDSNDAEGDAADFGYTEYSDSNDS